MHQKIQALKPAVAFATAVFFSIPQFAVAVEAERPCTASGAVIDSPT